jgi:hypothetical protein
MKENAVTKGGLRCAFRADRIVPLSVSAVAGQFHDFR